MKKFLTLTLVCIFFSCVTTTTHAATVAFDPQDSTVGTHTPFLIDVTLTSDLPINAVHIEIIFPAGITPVNISDGDSIINLWTTPPHFDTASRILTLEGIVPDGFSGIDGRLAVLTLSAEQPGTASINVDMTTSHAYKNTPDVAPELLSAQNHILDVSTPKYNAANDIPDSVPPETFTPLVMQSQGTFDNKWVLVFATQDKGSGIDHYEVRESQNWLPFFKSGLWYVAQSPYVLHDQSLHSTIYVKAFDKKGNVRTEVVPAPYPLPWYESEGISYILLGGIIILLLATAGYRFTRLTITHEA